MSKLPTPVNTKSLFNWLCYTMDKLDKKEITVNEALAQANLCKQANNLLMYELKRATIENLLENTNIRVREIEGKIVESNDKEEQKKIKND